MCNDSNPSWSLLQLLDQGPELLSGSSLSKRMELLTIDYAFSEAALGYLPGIAAFRPMSRLW